MKLRPREIRFWSGANSIQGFAYPNKVGRLLDHKKIKNRFWVRFFYFVSQWRPYFNLFGMRKVLSFSKNVRSVLNFHTSNLPQTAFMRFSSFFRRHHGRDFSFSRFRRGVNLVPKLAIVNLESREQPSNCINFKRVTKGLLSASKRRFALFTRKYRSRRAAYKATFRKLSSNFRYYYNRRGKSYKALKGFRRIFARRRSRTRNCVQVRQASELTKRIPGYIVKWRPTSKPRRFRRVTISKRDRFVDRVMYRLKSGLA